MSSKKVALQSNGRTFTGGIGVYDDVDGAGTHMYTNDTPSGQSDDHGGVELDFLGNTPSKKCIRGAN
jgi:hypothetical protein